eukprot:724064_1
MTFRRPPPLATDGSHVGMRGALSTSSMRGQDSRAISRRESARVRTDARTTVRKFKAFKPPPSAPDSPTEGEEYDGKALTDDVQINVAVPSQNPVYSGGIVPSSHGGRESITSVETVTSSCLSSSSQLEPSEPTSGVFGEVVHKTDLIAKTSRKRRVKPKVKKARKQRNPKGSKTSVR